MNNSLIGYRVSVDSFKRILHKKKDIIITINKLGKEMEDNPILIFGEYDKWTYLCRVIVVNLKFIQGIRYKSDWNVLKIKAGLKDESFM